MLRAKWFTPVAALEKAGELDDTAAGRRNYLKHLAWLSEDEPAQKALNFAAMAKGWAIGSIEFRKSLVLEHKEASAAIKQNQSEWQKLKHAMLEDKPTQLLWQIEQTAERSEAGWQIGDMEVSLGRSDEDKNRGHQPLAGRAYAHGEYVRGQSQSVGVGQVAGFRTEQETPMNPKA